uniref:Uncharacterized protein n=1 Tax=viral metagenome TaxID=1070528 RepID=A0A6C0EA62_9ZZZZ
MDSEFTHEESRSYRKKVIKDNIEKTISEGYSEFSMTYFSNDPLVDINTDIDICKDIFPDCLFSIEQADIETCKIFMPESQYSPNFLKLTIHLQT